MGILRITGQRPLSGTLTVSGRKNAALKLIAATILSDHDVVLTRVPAISDVTVMLEILKKLGGTVEQLSEDSYRINTTSVVTPVIPRALGRKLRASIVFVGPLLARFHTVTFPHPGGCVIGKRSIDSHLEALKALGAKMEFDGDKYTLSTTSGLQGTRVYLKDKSVTGTENAIMAACRAEGTTTLYRCAEESHIKNLCDLLRGMGYHISGDGTSTVVVEGQPDATTHATQCAVIADEIEVGTLVAASVVTGGTVTLEKVGSYEMLMPILSQMDDHNIQYRYNEAEEWIQVLPSPDLKAADIQTNPWPGFVPDLQSPFTVIATQAKGTSMVHDWMYEGRLHFVEQLNRMGADITICDPHRALVNGPTRLSSSSLITPDLRAGAALVLAALAAEGESTIANSEIIDRGYADIDGRLRQLGAEITRE